MADLALRRSGGSFLPKVDALVVDEAHDLEDTAAEHLGLRVQQLGTAVLLGRLWSGRRQRGLLARSPDDERCASTGRRYARRRHVGSSPSSGRGRETTSEGGTVTLDGAFPVADTLSPPPARARRRARPDVGGPARRGPGARARGPGAPARVGGRHPRRASWSRATARCGGWRQGGRGALSLSSAPIDVAPAPG